jgi:hypothetical protein
MSHDKIKSATRERMTVTGEPYAAARREAISEHRAASGRAPLPGGSMLLWINGPCGPSGSGPCSRRCERSLARQR